MTAEGTVGAPTCFVRWTLKATKGSDSGQRQTSLQPFQSQKPVLICYIVQTAATRFNMQYTGSTLSP
jgi:hypothetical protein